MIAILQTAFLGDTLLSLPLALNLKNSGFRQGREPLALICRQGLGAFFEQTKVFDRIIEVEKGSNQGYARARQELTEWWSKAERRVLVSPHESPRSKYFAFRLNLTRPKVQTIGYEDRFPQMLLSKLAYDHAIARPMDYPEAVRQIALLQAEVFSQHELWRERINEFRDRQERPGGRSRTGDLIKVPAWASLSLPILSGRKRAKRAVLAPGSVWATKQWTEAGFVSIGQKFADQGYAVSVIGSPEEKGLADRVAQGIGRGARSVAGEITLWQTAELLAESSFALVNDSGAMHLAALSATPGIAIFGPTVLDFGYRPWSDAFRIIEPHAPLKCRPCGKHGAQICPIKTHICMEGTTADRVWKEIAPMLRQGTPASP